MNSRISTVDFSVHPALVDGPGFIPFVQFGRKWLGERATDGTPIRTGWYEKVDAASNPVFPEYTIPENVFSGPLKHVSYTNLVGQMGEGSGFEPRTRWSRNLIGDGTSAIGPFTFNEAIALLSTTRIDLSTKESAIPVTSATTPGGTTTSSENKYPPTIIYNDPPSGEPTKLFDSPRGFYTAYGSSSGLASSWYFSDGESNISEDTDSGFIHNQRYCFSASSHMDLGYRSDDFRPPTQPGYQYLTVDIDNPSDFYVPISSFTPVYYGASAVYEETDYENPEAYKFLQKTKEVVLYSLQNDYYPYEDDFLREVGDTASGAEQSATKIKISNSFYYGTKKIDFSLYGIVTTYSTQVGGSVQLDVDVPQQNLEWEIRRFWPYKNANGAAVYNENTGVAINPPIP